MSLLWVLLIVLLVVALFGGLSFGRGRRGDGVAATDGRGGFAFGGGLLGLVVVVALVVLLIALLT